MDVSTTAEPVSRWAPNGDMRLHYLDARPSAGGAAVVVVPGFGEEAADHLDLVAALAPRRAVVVDLRGRGPSGRAAAGRYRMEDHVADLEAVVEHAGVERAHVVSYSRGTTYGLGWAVVHRDRVVSVAIGDYPAGQIVPPPDFPAMVRRRIWRGRPMTDRVPEPVVEALLADAVAVDLWDELGALDRPVLVIRGGAGGMIDDAIEDRYRGAVRDLRVVCFEESGHDLWSPDPDRFAQTVRGFLDEVEGAG